jgi:hypothetical protein
MDNRPARHDGILDRVAITLSGLCLVHCLLLPTFIVALPLLGQFSETHFHAQMLLVVVPVSLFAFGLAYRRHGSKAVADTALTMAGSIILATSHYFNNRLTGHARAS